MTRRAGAPARQFTYGFGTWQVLAADWDADGDSTVAVVDPAGVWYIRNANEAGPPDVAPFPYGLGGWTPLAGAFAPPQPAAVSRDLAAALNSVGLDGLDDEVWVETE